MAELAILPRCSAAELRVGFTTAAAPWQDTTLAPAALGNAQKDALNGNFAALGDNWALRRHVIIPATVAKTGALLKLLEFMDSAREREESRTRSELGELFSFRTVLMALFFDESTSSFQSRFNPEDERSLSTRQRSCRRNSSSTCSCRSILRY